MAIVLIYRAAIVLSPVAYRVVSSGQPSAGGAWLYVTDQLQRRLSDPAESDATLGNDLSEATGTVWNVATYTGTFSLRKLQAQWSILSAAGIVEDSRVVTFHLAKVSGAETVDTWAAADFTAARDAFLALWTTLKVRYKPHLVLTRTSFYLAGPGVAPPQPPVNTLDHSVAGTEVNSTSTPPQVAMSVTEKHGGLQRNWGRFYLPGGVTGGAQANLDDYGRFASGALTVYADALDTMYQAWLAASLPAVVYLPALPERSPTASEPRYVTKGTFAARAASARTVDQIQLDDVPDVIRSRRFDRANLRVLRDIS